MNELIVIHQKQIGNDEVNAVDARDLHNNLGVKKDFSNWIKQNISKLNLIENIDYCSFAQKGEREIGGTTRKEYLLTLDAGKHIAMMAGTEKGHEVRTYFIEFEKKAKNPLAHISDPHTRALITLLAENDAIKQEQARQAQQLEHVNTKLESLTPSHTAATLNSIQGLISHAAKAYKDLQEAKHLRISSPEAKGYITAMLLQREGVSDIGYIKNPQAALIYLRQVASRYHGELNAINERNSLFAMPAQKRASL